MASIKAKAALILTLAAAVSTTLVLQHQKNSRLLRELAVLREQSDELHRLREEVARATAEARLSSTQRDQERQELLRLRGELSRLKASQKKPLDTAGAAPQASQHKQGKGSGAVAEGSVRAEWKNVGFQLPADTVQTLEWAKINGQTNVVADALAWPDENSRAGIEAIFAAAPESVRARYGSADEYILSLFNHSGPLDDRHTITSYRILSETIAGDEAVLNMEYHYGDGSSFTSPQRYVRIENSWRQALDFDPPSQDKVRVSLQSEALPATSPVVEK